MKQNIKVFLKPNTQWEKSPKNGTQNTVPCCQKYTLTDGY